MQHELIDSIRDLALQYEKTDLDGALELMNIALKHRPDGPFIKAKVKEYELEKQYRLSENYKLNELVKKRKLAIIPVGFRCHTSMELNQRFGISQASLPFDSGFFPPQAVAKLLEDQVVELKYKDDGLSHRVCVKNESHTDPIHGRGIKFETKSYDYINSKAKSTEQSDINQYLDSTFGYYTLDCKFNYVLAHYNWHTFSSDEKSKGITDPDLNLKAINSTLNKRIERMIKLCRDVDFITFVFHDDQRLQYMQIDEQYYFLNDFSALENVCDKMFKNKYRIIRLDQVKSVNDLMAVNT